MKMFDMLIASKLFGKRDSFTLNPINESDIIQEANESGTTVTIPAGYVSEQFTITVPPVANGFSIEVSTEEEMNAALTNATASDVGKIYKYTGATGTYTQGELYILQEG